MNRNEPDFVALALDAEVHDALAALHITQPLEAEFLAADAMIEQGGKYRAIPYTLQRVGGGAFNRRRACASRRAVVLPSLLLAAGRLTPSTGIAEDGVELAEIVEQRGKC